MIMQPSILLGTVVGVILNVIFPSYVLVLILVVTLSFSSVNMFKKAIVMHKKEKGGARELVPQTETESESNEKYIAMTEVHEQQLSLDVLLFLL